MVRSADWGGRCTVVHCRYVNEVILMKKVITGTLTVAIALAIGSSTSVQAQIYRSGPTATINNPQIFHFNERQATNDEKAGEKNNYTPDQKAASDLKMTSGLNLLREAKASLESNNMPATASNLIAAYDDINGAIPHYYGHRVKSLRATRNTYMELYNSQGRNLTQADQRLNNAIAEAQKALSVW
jgi:hypothetical protein